VAKNAWTYKLHIRPHDVHREGTSLHNFALYKSDKSISISFSPLPNAVIKRDLQVLSVRQEVRSYSVTYRQSLDDHPNSLAKSLVQRTNHSRRLKRHYPANLGTRF